MFNFNYDSNYYKINFDITYNSKIYPFLNKEYALKFKYLLFEINKVITNTKINKIEVIKVVEMGKYQSMLK